MRVLVLSSLVLLSCLVLANGAPAPVPGQTTTRILAVIGEGDDPEGRQSDQRIAELETIFALQRRREERERREEEERRRKQEFAKEIADKYGR